MSSPKKLSKTSKMCTALDALEQDIIALQDVVDIMDDLPIENPKPFYLYRRIARTVRDCLENGLVFKHVDVPFCIRA